MKRFAPLLAAVLACGILDVASIPPDAHAAERKITWAGCSISKNAFMSEMVKAYKKKTGIEVELKGGGATKGIREVSAHKVDIGGTCRQVLEDTDTLRTPPEERRVQLTPVAWDALVVIVNKNNPVSNVTLDQVRALYTGKITNWKQLGGRDAPVELYVRAGKISGVGRTVREIIFHDYDQEFVANHVVKTSGDVERGIVDDANGVGITGISSARRIDVKILSLEGKEPTYDNIKNGDYLLYRPLYMVTNLENQDPEVKNFVDFVMGPEGRAIMRSVGTVPYQDAIGLWLKYLEQQNLTMAGMQGQIRASRQSGKTVLKATH